MIAIDTNLLIYAHRSGTAEHRSARRAIEKAIGSSGGCGIALPSIAEFFSIVTNAAVGRPSTAAEARDFLAALEDAGVALLGPGPSFAIRLLRIATDLDVTGARIFDLQIALCALDGGAGRVWTNDHRFVKLPGLAIEHPW
jgi:toxin-antitoxin system PIN domain toxin